MGDEGPSERAELCRAGHRAERGTWRLLIVLAALAGASAWAAPPDGFVDEQVIDHINSPSGFKFAPDGRLFFAERVDGALRTASYDPDNDAWLVEPQPYATFDIPVDGSGQPAAHRSSGLRDFAFDPDFLNNGRVYVFYMRHNPRHNRVVCITQDPADSRRALPDRTVLLDLPFSSSGSSGSHNGGAVAFGADGRLYVTTGDGWNGGDNVQSLATYTGKVFRINADGTIPTDNPFYGQASGAFRAVFCLGLRNPYSMTRHPISGALYVNEANGPDKTNVMRVAPGANFGHQGYGGIGIESNPWHDTSISSSSADKLITGGAWNAPASGALPPEYDGRLFVCHWGGNNSSTGVISTVRSESDLTTERFADDVPKPVNIRIGPDGQLYYMYTTYQTTDGRIHRIRYTGQQAAVTPQFTPPAGSYVGSIALQMSTATSGADIHYTLDGSQPTQSSARYTQPLLLTASTSVRARAFAPGLAPSAIREAFFEICADTTCNLPPVAHAGADRTVAVGRQAYLSGSASYDPDTDELLLIDGWRQVAGAPVTLLNNDETVAYFTPNEMGWYTFEYQLADELSVSTDTVDIFVVPCIDRAVASPLAEWKLDQGLGDVALDTASGSHHGTLDGPAWVAGRTGDARFAAGFDGIDDAIDLGFLDVDAPGLTLSAWIRIAAPDEGEGRIISKASGVGEADHVWMLSTIQSGNDNVLRVRLRTDSGPTATLVASGGVLPIAAWTHVAATYDGATLTLWQDGAAVGSAARSGRVATDPTVPAAIGNQPARNRPFAGSIDDVRIFDRGLNAQEIALLAAFFRPFDVDRSGRVDQDDHAAFLAEPVDLNGDGQADGDDETCLLEFLTCGIAPGDYLLCVSGPSDPIQPGCAGRDVNGDARIDLVDIAELQARSGQPCP